MEGNLWGAKNKNALSSSTTSQLLLFLLSSLVAHKLLELFYMSAPSKTSM